MNELRREARPSSSPGIGCPVALYSPGTVSMRANAMNALRRRKILSRQRPPNELVASLPPSLGARLIRRGHSYFLKLERNEQTIAHLNSPEESGVQAQSASKLLR